eukprot:2010710-Amphidinium_carterae.1
MDTQLCKWCEQNLKDSSSVGWRSFFGCQDCAADTFSTLHAWAHGLKRTAQRAYVPFGACRLAVHP